MTKYITIYLVIILSAIQFHALGQPLTNMKIDTIDHAYGQIIFYPPKWMEIITFL